MEIRIPDVCPVCYWYSSNINGLKHCCRFLHHQGKDGNIYIYVNDNKVPDHCPLKQQTNTVINCNRWGQ